MATRVRSFSKINLGLAIGPVRDDGFHGLVTLYQTLALHDVVTVEARLVEAEAADEKQIPPLRSGMTSVDEKQIPPLRSGMTSVGEKQIPPLRSGMTSVGEKQIPPLRSGMTSVGEKQIPPLRSGMTSVDEKQIPPLRSGMTSVGEKQIPPLRSGMTNGGYSSRASGGHSVISLTTNHPGVPTDGRNTAWKMVERALERMGVEAEVKIHIEKELPVQGGLGAGSANAAAALIGLERELGFTLSELARMELAAEVGSDVPLFLVGGAVLGTERGERVREMPDLPRTWCVVAVPEVGVSTPRAFQEWDQRQVRGSGFEVRRGTELTSSEQPDRLEELSHVYASVFAAQASDTSGIVRGRQGSSSSETKQGGLEEQRFTSEQGSAQDGLAGNNLLALVRTGIGNDFEEVVFPQYPLLREIKHELMGTPADGLREGRPDDLSGKALYAALSGSGSALFGLYGSEADARAAQQRVQASGCKAILTETLPRAEYWARMFAE